MYPARAVRGKSRPPKPPENPLALPNISLELLEDRSPPAQSGFLRLVRRLLIAKYPDGTSSEPFVYDEVDRRALDATVIAAHYLDESGVRHVYLRSALRPPVYYRDGSRSPIAFPDRGGGLWELPAGLVEASEQSPEGVRRSAARELDEELGFSLKAEELRELGPSTYPSPGVLAERHFFYEALVDPATRHEPELDGSALERFGVVVPVPLVSALAMCSSGNIEDGKTELALRRLHERYA